MNMHSDNLASLEPLPIPKACALRGRDIHDMVGLYANTGASWQGRQTDLLSEVLGLDSSNDPALAVLAWDIKPSLAQTVCLVEAGSPHDPWLLRTVQAPEGIWLGLHRAGPAAGKSTPSPALVFHSNSSQSHGSFTSTDSPTSSPPDLWRLR